MGGDVFLGVAVGALSASVFVAAGILNFGIVWHVRNLPEVKKTLVNKLISDQFLISWAFAAKNAVEVVSVHFAGPAPIAACDLSAIATSSFLLAYLLNADFIIILRVLLRCVFKGSAVVNEGLVRAFLTIITFSLPIYFAVLRWWSGRYRSIMWFECAGTEGTEEKSIGLWTFVVASVALHVAGFAALSRQKTNAVYPEGEDGTGGAAGGSSALKFALVDQKAAITAIGVFVAGHLSLTVLRKTASEAMGMRPGHFFLFMTLWSTAVISVVFPAVVYAKADAMRAKVGALYRDALVCWNC